MNKDFAAVVMETEAKIAPLLSGLGPDVQAAVLADLFAMLLAGHVGPDAEMYREILIKNWLETVHKLVPVNEKIILEQARCEGKA